MVDTGYTAPTGRIVVRGEAPIKAPKNVGVATNMYPGRIVVREATDYDVKVGDGLLPPVGVLGFEDTNVNVKPATIDTIYAVDTEAMVLGGGGFAFRGKLAKGFVAVKGDYLFSWSDGRVAPGKLINGCPAIKIPFVKKTSEFDTGIDLVAGMIVTGAEIEVLTNVASGTIDVGLLSTESGGDADGYLDGVSCATAGIPELSLVDASDANNTLGMLLAEAAIKSSDGTPLYARIAKRPGAVVGAATSITYTTSNHDIAGNIYLAIESPGVRLVGVAGAGASAAAADADIFVEAVI